MTKRPLNLEIIPEIVGVAAKLVFSPTLDSTRRNEPAHASNHSNDPSADTDLGLPTGAIRKKSIRPYAEVARQILAVQTDRDPAQPELRAVNNQ